LPNLGFYHWKSLKFTKHFKAGFDEILRNIKAKAREFVSDKTSMYCFVNGGFKGISSVFLPMLMYNWSGAPFVEMLDPCNKDTKRVTKNLLSTAPFIFAQNCVLL